MAPRHFRASWEHHTSLFMRPPKRILNVKLVSILHLPFQKKLVSCLFSHSVFITWRWRLSSFSFIPEFVAEGWESIHFWLSLLTPLCVHLRQRERSRDQQEYTLFFFLSDRDNQPHLQMCLKCTLYVYQVESLWGVQFQTILALQKEFCSQQDIVSKDVIVTVCFLTSILGISPTSPWSCSLFFAVLRSSKILRCLHVCLDQMWCWGLVSTYAMLSPFTTNSWMNESSASPWGREQVVIEPQC